MSGYVLNYLLTEQTKREHRARWFVWAGGQKMRHTAQMRGMWGYDVQCSCGWESKTGGATRSSVESDLFDHRHSEQCSSKNARADR